MDKKAQDLYKGLPLNVMAYTKEIFDALKSTEATIKINALFNYLRPGPQSDLTKQENLVEFVKRCATRKIVDKIKSNSGVEETEEAYLKRIAQEVYNTAKITENIRLGTDEKGDVHFYVKFGKNKEVRDEYEINTEDTLTVVREIYQQFIIEIEDEEKPAMNYVLGVSTIKKVTEDDVRKIELKRLENEQEQQKLEMARLQHIVSEGEKALRKMEEEKAKREIEFKVEFESLKKTYQEQLGSLRALQETIKAQEQKEISELKKTLEEEREKNLKLQQNLAESQRQMRTVKKENLSKQIEIIEEGEKKQQEIYRLKRSHQKELDEERQIVINLRKKFDEQKDLNLVLNEKLEKCQEENREIKKEKIQQEMQFLEELERIENIKDPGQYKLDDEEQVRSN